MACFEKFINLIFEGGAGGNIKQPNYQLADILTWHDFKQVLEDFER